jgi:hypothetical protein
MNAPEFKTLADPMFQSIFNKGESTMNDETTEITCETGEERPSTTLISSSSPVDSVSTIVQGVSGATYAPMDTSPQAQTGLDPIAILDDMMARFQISMRLMVTALQKQSNAQTDLEEAVSVALEQADWFRHRVEDSVTDAIRDTDFDYELGNSVERYMRNEFDPNDHVDFHDLVNDRVDDVIDGIVEEKIQDLLEERLADLLEEKLANANITINF